MAARRAQAHPAPNNWYLFPYTVAGFLESVGRGDAETAAARERAPALLESWYRGDGWYADGDGRAFDHYNGWALHLYPVLDAHLAGDADALAHHGGRLRAHLDALSLMFGADGAPLHFGRSLTYRFAASAAVSLGAVTGHTPLTPGASRRIASGALRHFLDRGALTSEGLLSLGWYGPHEASLQEYSGPASPYWASKAFVALLAPADHALWTDTEEPAPVEEADRVLSLPGPGLLLQATRADGTVRLHNHGSDHVRPHEGESAADDNPHYGRLAYSTRTGPTARANVADNHLSVEVAGRPSVRRRIHPLGAGHGDGWGWAASWHRPVFVAGPPMVPGLRAESVTVAHGNLELRVHRVVGAPPGSRVTLTGWATGPEEPTVSALHGLYGWDDPAPEPVPAPQGTAWTPWARVPRLTGGCGGTTVHLALACLTTGPDAPPPLERAVTDVRVEDQAVELTWTQDGSRTRVSFEPPEVRHTRPERGLPDSGLGVRRRLRGRRAAVGRGVEHRGALLAALGLVARDEALQGGADHRDLDGASGMRLVQRRSDLRRRARLLLLGQVTADQIDELRRVALGRLGCLRRRLARGLRRRGLPADAGAEVAGLRAALAPAAFAGPPGFDAPDLDGPVLLAAPPAVTFFCSRFGFRVPDLTPPRLRGAGTVARSDTAVSSEVSVTVGVRRPRRPQRPRRPRRPRRRPRWRCPRRRPRPRRAPPRVPAPAASSPAGRGRAAVRPTVPAARRSPRRPAPAPWRCAPGRSRPGRRTAR